MSEILQKLGQLRDLASRHAVDAILLQRVSSLAWATGGASTYVNIARSNAEASILLTENDQYLITNNIEAVRLDKEEKLTSQGWKLQINPWFDQESARGGLMGGLKLGADGCLPGVLDLSEEIAHLRAQLNQEEGKRFKMIAQFCAQAMSTAASQVQPGMTEYEIGGLLAREGESRGVQVIVNLIAVDERIFNFRHPLPTDKKLDHYVMMVCCGRRLGLVCSLTRFIYFGKLPDEIRRKAEAVARVDATMIAATRPGANLGQIFTKAQEAYAEAGYPDEWQLHHQGGPAGYEPREYLATPGSKDEVVAGQVFAWNPSITGCKSEDSILINESGFEILTATPDWPTLQVALANQTVERPGILIVD